MIYLLIVIVIALILYLLWRNPWHGGDAVSAGGKSHLFIWILIGLLTLAALVDPKLGDKIRNLKQKIR